MFRWQTICPVSVFRQGHCERRARPRPRLPFSHSLILFVRSPCSLFSFYLLASICYPTDKDIANGAHGPSPGFSSTFNQANGTTPSPLELSQALEIRAFQRASHLDRVAPRDILRESTPALQQVSRCSRSLARLKGGVNTTGLAAAPSHHVLPLCRRQSDKLVPKRASKCWQSSCLVAEAFRVTGRSP